jgi:sigma-E factor negative regulatory protein RseC
MDEYKKVTTNNEFAIYSHSVNIKYDAKKDEYGVNLTMKKEEGIVIEVIGTVTKVKLGRHNDCSNCGACPGNNALVIDVQNSIGALPGQRVELLVKETSVLKAAFVVFILPLISSFFGAVLGGWIGEWLELSKQIMYIVGALMFFTLSVIYIKFYDKRTNSKVGSHPVITQVLS